MPQTVASHVLATDLTVPGPEEWWRAVTSRAGDLRRLGAHHVVAYAALREPGRVFVTIGLRHREPLDRLLRSRAVFDWFDATGVEQIPPLFAGSVVEKIGVDLPGSEAGSAHPEAVVIAAILEVDDVELVRDSIHAQTDRFVALFEPGAGVLWHRIDIGMPLQTDATFPYYLGRNTFEVTLTDLKTDHPYNTYTNKGLPPGPIGNPGLNSILAAAQPVKSNYVFFLSDRQGNFHYSITYEGHLANKKRYLD